MEDDEVEAAAVAAAGGADADAGLFTAGFDVSLEADDERFCNGAGGLADGCGIDVEVGGFDDSGG